LFCNISQEEARTVKKSTGGLGASVIFALLVAQNTFATAPNVIVMVADDLGWNDVGFHGGDIQTPSLDKLASEGVRLNRF
jgi:hypothetical protein